MAFTLHPKGEYYNRRNMVDNTTIVDTLTGLVVYALDGKEFCADIKDISAIINPKELKGKVDLDSEEPFVMINDLVIPILDLHKLFELRRESKQEDERILTVEPDGFIFGFVVDRVKEIFTMNNEFKNRVEFISMEKETNLVGVINFEGRSLYLPDFKGLYRNLEKN